VDVLRLLVVGVVLVSSAARADRGDDEITAVAACEAGTPASCLDAANALERRHETSRLGHTVRDLRERALALGEQKCAAGDGDACNDHGRLLLKRGDASGTEHIARGCALGSGDACLYLGNHSGNRTRAKAWFEQACAHDSARGCELLAYYVDKARAIELHRKACEGDDGVACTRSGEQRRAAGDRAGAFADFDKACQISELASCDAAGQLAPEPARARELFQRACDAGIGAGCGHLGELVARGEGGERDWGHGIELAEHGCALDKDARCARAVTLRAHPPDWHCTTHDECKRMCDEKIARSCRALGQLEGDSNSAIIWYEYACDAGDATSCLIAGNADTTIEGAAGRYAHGCTLGDATACTYSQYAHAHDGSAAARDALAAQCPRNLEACVLYGLAIEKHEPARAAKLWRDACARKHGAACRYVANQLESPHGSGICDCEMHTPTNAELAEAERAKKLHEESQRYLKLGCAAGDTRSCDTPFDQDPRPRKLTTPGWE
jgi:TPR repeat protein